MTLRVKTINYTTVYSTGYGSAISYYEKYVLTIFRIPTNNPLPAGVSHLNCCHKYSLLIAPPHPFRLSANPHVNRETLVTEN